MVSEGFRKQLEGYGLTTAEILYRLPDHPAKRIDQLLPWRWTGANKVSAAA